MTLAELLKAKGIEDNIIAEIQNEMKSNKIFTASEENLDIRYGKLKTQHDGKIAELAEANNLIAELKKNNAGNEGLQQKITEYEAQIQQLQGQLKETQIESEANVALLAAGVKPDDIDYVMFKLKAKGELELDENGKIKGMEDKVAALKTQFPTHFETTAQKKIIENRLPGSITDSVTVTKDKFREMSYEERMNLKKSNEELYKQYAKN